MLVYLRGHEGRGIGLANKIRAYALQDHGLDTVEANTHLGFAPDGRDYAVAARILSWFGIRTLELMTNNPAKTEALRRFGLEVARARADRGGSQPAQCRLPRDQAPQAGARIRSARRHRGGCAMSVEPGLASRRGVAFDGTAPRLALVGSRFNEAVVEGLARGVDEWLGENGIAIHAADRFEAPGAWELPLIGQTLARSGRYDGVICLGCVIKGDTAHFEFISLGAAVGLMQASLASEVPIAFGVLTTYTDAQAAARSRADAHNKGREAAAACVGSALVLAKIRGGAGVKGCSFLKERTKELLFV